MFTHFTLKNYEIFKQTKKISHFKDFNSSFLPNSNLTFSDAKNIQISEQSYSNHQPAEHY